MAPGVMTTAFEDNFERPKRVAPAASAAVEAGPAALSDALAPTAADGALLPPIFPQLANVDASPAVD
ncbi:hypothetical protein ACMWQU_27790, partial [Escherichia coli]|uniref:hypothetical protein n=1 Tax=Escherichia coli TaxID=562 RepID=UPI0039E041CF